MSQARAHPPRVRSPISGAVGLMLILAYPLANLIVGMGVVLVPVPPLLGVFGGLVLLAGTALVAAAGLPDPARRWLAAAAVLAALAFVSAFLPQPELGLAPVRVLLAGASLAALSLGMRSWFQAAGDRRGDTWWTLKAGLDVLGALSMALVGPLGADVTDGTAIALPLGFLAAFVALARLVVHVGAIATGLQAFSRLFDPAPGALAGPGPAAGANASPPAPATGGQPAIGGQQAVGAQPAHGGQSPIPRPTGGAARADAHRPGEVTWSPPRRRPQPARS